MSEQPTEQPGTRYELVFTASGEVAQGPGPDALPVPEKEDEE